MVRELFTIIRAGDPCPKCLGVWGESAEGRIKSIRIECDSFCTFRNECQAEIDQNGLEGFQCKDRRWGPQLGARCENNMAWHNGCNFALIGAGANDQPIPQQFQDGYPNSWDGF